MQFIKLFYVIRKKRKNWLIPLQRFDSLKKIKNQWKKPGVFFDKKNKNK